jgi:hypothetical protein
MTTEPKPWTPTSWVKQVLQDAGDKLTQANINDLLHWLPAEELVSDWWDRNNPLNASLGTGSSDGLGSYSTLGVGAEYTARMLEQKNMSGIQDVLKTGNAPLSKFSAAVVASPWSGDHYGGNPTHIAQTVPGGGAAPTSAGMSSGGSTAGGVTGNILNTTPLPEVGTVAGKAARAAVPVATFLADPIGHIFTSGKTLIIRGTLILVGIILVLIGVSKLFGQTDSNPVQTVVEGSQNVASAASQKNPAPKKESAAKKVESGAKASVEEGAEVGAAA